jgi:23S rRNA (uracil1939-C5)-methyltransferase
MESGSKVRVARALYGGGFATEGGETLPLVLPGELVKLEPGGGVRVVEASAERVAPGCVHFGTCGGCQYQHAGYPEQLRLKAGILRDLFSKQGLAGLPEAEVHAAEPWGYRNRVRFRVRQQEGRTEVGYSRRGTNEFLAIRMCPIAAPALWRAAAALMELGARDAVCGRWLGLVSEVELFATGDETRLQAQLFLRSAAAPREQGYGFEEFCGRLKGAIPELVGAGVEVDPELGRRERKAWGGASWGAAGLAYEVARRSYWVGRGAFFQVNRLLVDRLVALVTDGSSGALAWDLYAGVGLFSRPLAEGFGAVVAVEGGEAAAASLAAGGKGGAIRAVRSGILEFLRARVIERERPELVVLDPPRAGLGAEGCGLLSRIGAAEVVYVSCDPTTLARDLSVLCGGGYDVVKLDLVDLFPQTFHLETVVRLRRR